MLTAGIGVYSLEKINDASNESLIKRKSAKREMLTAGIGGFIKEKINDAGKESLIKRKPAEREMLTAGVVCPMRFERTTFRVGV